MKPITFTLILICAVAMVSCRKDRNNVDIKTYDQQQMVQYMSENGLTSSMQRDLTSGDTTGMYYQILTPGNTAKPIDYSTQVSVVYTLKSFDGKFASTDTTYNHYYNFVGHIQNNQYMAKGVMLALINNLKYVGGRMRLLVPSHLAFGTAGRGTGSSDANNRVAGNQGLDYYINIVDNQAAYDDVAIKNYILANNWKESDFTKLPSGVRYRITRAGVASNTVTATSVLEVQYSGFLFDGILTADSYNTSTGTGVSMDLSTDTHTGLRQALLYGTPGAQMTVLVPSTLAYGTDTNGGTIPVNSCYRYDVNILSVQQ
ncbi:FKBP-type peptidyl-prolyl isomerase-like protein [Mucilaginibacter yixingensis]|uniref:Peptidyl-prolyl cis-trans isomerase n=1 Tax=Mucilaginibacter yixingensis TaxID=1295612 RepID=A0A2T5JE33_9SPHI|nr:FKBP-type peptidyl-prolyl cis-trans isomerase [Mucilaginibacter yixingensis]PTR00038.1 FKBP-type peptidyl-prolyl isomerase-like protein [Mucilaginibacter yixingensis]